MGALSTCPPTPTPTATPPQNPIQGDINCANGVNQDDFFLLLQFAAALSNGVTPESCPDLGDPEPLSGFPWGDVNCDNLVNITDALYVVGFKAGIALPQPLGCTPIGSAIT